MEEKTDKLNAPESDGMSPESHEVPKNQSLLLRLKRFFELASGTVIGIVLGFSVFVVFWLQFDNSSVVSVVRHTLPWIGGLFLALVLVAILGRFAYWWYMSGVTTEPVRQLLRTFEELSRNPDKVSDTAYLRTRLISSAAPSIRACIAFLSFHSAFAAALAMAGSVAIISTFAVQYLQVDRLTEQNKLIRMQAELAEIDQRYTYEMDQAQGDYREIVEILSDSKASSQSQAYAINKIPTVMRMSVTRSDGIDQSASEDGEEEYKIKLKTEYPNVTRLRDRLKTYLLDDRELSLLEQSGLLRKYGGRDEIPHAEAMRATVSLNVVSQALASTLHQLGPTDGESASEVNSLWNRKSGSDLPLCELRQVADNSLGQEAIDLRHIELTGAQLPGVDLSSSNMQRERVLHGNLKGALFVRSDLREANFDGTDLRGAIMVAARMSGASFSNVKLQGAFMPDAVMQNVMLGGADLRGANLNDSSIQGSSLDGSDLKGAILDNVDMRGASFRGVDLQGVHIYESNLRGVELLAANMRGAFLSAVDLAGANLLHATLGGGPLRGVLKECGVGPSYEFTSFDPSKSTDGQMFELPPTLLTVSNVDVSSLMAPYSRVVLKFSDVAEYKASFEENRNRIESTNNRSLVKFLKDSINAPRRGRVGSRAEKGAFSSCWYDLDDRETLERLFGKEHVAVESVYFTLFDENMYAHFDGLSTNAHTKSLLLDVLDAMPVESEKARKNMERVREGLERAIVLTNEEVRKRYEESFADWLVEY